MNVEVETNPAGKDWPVAPATEAGWSWKKTGLLIALAFAAHLAFIFIFGAKKTLAPRIATRVPQFQIAANDPTLIALDDPTLFVVPHVQDFVPAVWRCMPDISRPSFGSTEPLPFLLPQVETLGAAFNEFMQTNHFAAVHLNFKPEPRFSMPIVPAISLLPEHSTLHVSGELADRRMIAPVSVPTLPHNDVIAPSRVQVLVDTSGRVISDVLLDSNGYDKTDHYDKADQMALELARTARFAPTNRLMFGEFIFHWHTTPKPATATNTPAFSP